jgi:photosystem II stability/assembly factor-like uncharacterized protein
MIDVTVDGGRSWTGQATPSTPGPALSGISCPDDNHCMAVGSSPTSPSTGVVLTTRDGGRAWAASTTPAGAIDVINVRCASMADCTAIASDGTNLWSAHSSDFGHTWQREGDLPAGLVDTGSLACTAGGTCLVAGYSATTAGHGQGAVVISTDGGASWTAATVPAGTGLLQGVTCTTATACLAVGTTSTTVSDVVPAHGELLHSTDGGHTWSADSTPPPVDDVYGINCPDQLVCAMVGINWNGGSGVGTGAMAQSTDGGASFTASTTAYTPLGLDALACPTARQCVAVGGDTVARVVLPGVNKSRSGHRSAG